MQVTPAGFTAEERDTVRKIAQSLQMSWKKDSTLGTKTFTVGTSAIGGNDAVGANPGALGSPANYRYFDESNYLLGLTWEKGYNMPTGGIAKSLAEARLANTSGRFTPRYMGGNSELFTAILPRRPAIISAGFNYNGIDQSILQFAGIVDKQPVVDSRSREISLSFADYIDFFQSRFLDQSAIFTSQTTDQVIETLLVQMGLSTSQYDLDPGINVIPFGRFEKGSYFADIINKLVEAENGHFYQDEEGIFKFENRQHWNIAPYINVQKVIYTSDVINAESPNVDHVINVVEVNSKQYKKLPEQIIFRLNPYNGLRVPGNSTESFFFEFENPALSVTTPTSTGTLSYFVANTEEDGSGTNLTSSLSVSSIYNFSNSAKVTFRNTSANAAYLVNLVISGRQASPVADIYTRKQDDSSVTAYEERKLTIDNEFIQSQDWAESYAQMVLNDFAEIENLQKLTIIAKPDLQLGDLVSWQGRYWRIFDVKSTLSPESGFIQELTLLQRSLTSYFRIGLSSIGGTDKIAP